MGVDPSKLIYTGIALIIVMVAMLAMFPTVIAQVETATADYSTWNFTGAEGTASLIGLIPFGWGAGVAILGIVGALALAMGIKGGKY